MSVIDDYLMQYSPPIRNELERIRAIALTMLPDCEEAITYSMPTIKYKGKSIIGFDSHKNHIGIYPFSSQVISDLKELKAYDTTKGAIHENLNQPLPDSLIKKIILKRIKQSGTSL